MSERLLAIRVVLIIFAGVATVCGQSSVSDEEPFQKGHTRDITEVSLSPDGQKIASYSAADGSLRIWDLRSQRLLWSSQIVTLEEADKDRGRTVTALAWSIDSEMLATGTSYGTVIALQATSGRKLWANEDCKPYVNVLAFSSTADSVACGTAANPPDGSVALLDSQSGRLIRSFRGSLGSQFWLKIDGKDSISAGEHGGLLRHWDITSGRLLAERKLPVWGCPSVPNPSDFSFSPDGRYIAFRCGATTQVLDMDSGNSVVAFKLKVDWRRGMKFSVDGNRLAISDLDEFRVFDLGTGREFEVAQHSRTGETFDLSRDGSLLVEGGSSRSPSITVSSTETGRVIASLMGHPGVVEAISFAPDGSEFAISGQDGVVRSFDVKTKRQKIRFVGTSMARALAYTPDSNNLVVGCDDGNVYIVERETGSVRLVAGEHQQAVQTIAFSKDGYFVATGGGSMDRAVRIWRLSDWSLVRKILTPGETRTASEIGSAVFCCGSAVQGLAFTKDGTAITAALENGAIYTWLIQTGDVLRSETSRRSISAAGGAPGILAIAPGDGKRVQILGSRTLTLRRTLGEHSEYSHAIAFDASGSVIATGDIKGNTTVWAVRTGKRRGMYPSEGSVNAVALSSEGALLATGGEDQSTKLWSVQHGVLVFDLLNELSVPKQ